MDISVTDFRANCLKLLRSIEQKGEVIEIKRRGRVVARLSPPLESARSAGRPWERLRGSGVLNATAGESVLAEGDFDALRS